jgi:hypothetical protein
MAIFIPHKHSIADHSLRNRIGPLACLGSTILPRWVIAIFPSATSLSAAARTGFISGSQAARSLVPASARAASEGQIVRPWARWLSSFRMASSIA